MAQTFLEPFSVSGMDCQTAVAVQSLLESTVGEAADDEDVFQCGKCKKQFTSLAAFVNHKQSRCMPQKSIQQMTNAIGSAVNTVPASSSVLQNVNKGAQLIQTSYNTMPQTSITQLPQNMVLTDDLMSFTPVDQTLGTSAIQLQGATLQSAGPFLSQVTSFSSRSPSNVTILSPVNTTTSLPSSGSAFTSTVHSANQIQLQPVQQHITLTALPEAKPIAPNVGNIAKPSPTKAGRKSAQASLVTVVSADSLVKLKRSKNGSMVLDEKRKLRCNYCDKTFAKNFDLNQHIRAHTGEKPFQCIVCGRAFAQKSNVKKHMATHKVWPAGAGSTLPSQPSPLLIEEDHPPSEDISQNLMTGEETLAQVNDVPQVVVMDANPVVDTTLGNQNGFQDSSQPSENKSPDDNAGNTKVKVMVDNSYLCQYCSAKFKTYFQLKTHMVQHKDQQVYKCVVKECQETFKDLDSFLEHIKSHEDDMSYRCHMCNKFFPSLYDLGVHQYTHSLYPNQGIKPGPRHFQCTKCMNKYSTPEALEHHLTTSTHNHACPHCEKTFTCERYLRRHLPSHGSEGQFQCPTCDKKFKGEHYLKMHLLIHSGEKPFQCEVCSASFNRKDKLKRHMLIHDSNKRYRCPFKALTGCQKEFNRPDKLKSHILTHSGIKPHKCRECGRSFGRKPHLREHERGHKADYKFKCETCGKGFFRPKLFHSHKCHPLKPGQAHVFRPRNKRKVGRPKKRVSPETVGVRIENTMSVVDDTAEKNSREDNSSATEDAERDETMQNGPSEISETNKYVVGANGQEQVGSLVTMAGKRSARNDKSGKKPEFCVKVSAPPPPPPPVTPRYVTVHIQNGSNPTASDIQTQLLPSHTTQPLLPHQTGPNGNIQPITIIEAQPVQMHLPMMAGMDNSTGDTITMQMAANAESLAQSVAAVGGVVSELIPVAVAMQETPDSMVATQVVVTSAGTNDQGYITCPATLEDYGTSDGDLVLQGTENFLKSHAEMYQSVQQ